MTYNACNVVFNMQFMCLLKLQYPKQTRSCKTSSKHGFPSAASVAAFDTFLLSRFCSKVCRCLMASQNPDVHPKAGVQYQSLLCSSILFCYLHDILSKNLLVLFPHSGCGSVQQPLDHISLSFKL